MVTEGQKTIGRLADYQILSGIFWMVLGAIQISTFFLFAIAGVWNIYAGITRYKSAKRIRSRDVTIPKEFESVTQLIIIGVVNLILGGFVGLIFVGLDFYIRDKVLTNAHLFDGSAPSLYPSGAEGANLGGADFESQLRVLAKLRDDGVITPGDFDLKKRSLLGL